MTSVEPTPCPGAPHCLVQFPCPDDHENAAVMLEHTTRIVHHVLDAHRDTLGALGAAYALMTWVSTYCDSDVSPSRSNAALLLITDLAVRVITKESTP